MMQQYSPCAFNGGEQLPNNGGYSIVKRARPWLYQSIRHIFYQAIRLATKTPLKNCEPMCLVDK